MLSKSFPFKGRKDQSKAYLHGELLEVLPADKLLSSVGRVEIIAKIRKLVNESGDFFEEYYHSLIKNFAELVQVMPVKWFARLGSLLDDGLVRGYLALKILNDSHQDKASPAFNYALFSAALLRDLAELYSDKKVMISNKEGIFQSEWLPFSGTLVQHAKYYKLRRYARGYLASILTINALLARQVMPENGFLWIASEPTLLDMWLACLQNEEERSGGGLGHILSLAITRLVHLPKQDRDLGSFEINITKPSATRVGEAFYKWLQDGIANGTILVDSSDANVFLTEAGMYLGHPGIFQEFIHFYSQHQEWRVAFKQFNHLGIFPLSGDDYRFEQYFAKCPGLDRKLSGSVGHAADVAKAGKFKRDLPSRIKTVGIGGFIKHAQGPKSPAPVLKGPIDSRFMLESSENVNIQEYINAKTAIKAIPISIAAKIDPGYIIDNVLTPDSGMPGSK